MTTLASPIGIRRSPTRNSRLCRPSKHACPRFIPSAGGQCWKVVGRKQRAGVIELPQRDTEAELDRIAARDHILKGSITDEQPVFTKFKLYAKMLGWPGNQSLVEVEARSILPRAEGVINSMSVDIADQMAESGTQEGLNFQLGAGAQEVIGHTD